MGFLRRLFGGTGGTTADRNALHLYIKCARCGTIVHVRVNLQNDLAADYGDTKAEGYALNKDVMDDRCFRLIHVEIQFDGRRNEVSRQIEGGTFVSEAEWDTQEQERAAKSRT